MATGASMPPDLGGICGTSLKIERVQSELQKHFKTTASIVSHEANEIGAGKGFLSCMARVKINWSEENANLPASVVVKIPTPRAFEGMLQAPDETMRKMAEAILKNFNRLHASEVYLYSTYASDPSFPVPIPKCYGACEIDVDDSPGFIIEEDMSSGTGQANFAQGLTLDQMKSVVGMIARLQAWSLKNKWQNEKLQNDLEAIMGGEEDQLTNGMEKFHAWFDTQPHLKDHFSAEELAELSKIQTNKKVLESLKTAHIDAGLPSVFVHGDMWSNNVLLKMADDGSLGDVLAVIDWQIVHEGSPGEDLARLLTSSVSSDVRENHQDEILKHYYDEFVKANGGSAPFTLLQFTDLFEQAFAMSATFILPMMPQFINMFKSPEEGGAGMKIAGVTEEQLKTKLEGDVIGLLKDTCRMRKKHNIA